MLVQGYRAEDWMLQLAKNLKVTQMYDYFVTKKWYSCLDLQYIEKIR